MIKAVIFDMDGVLIDSEMEYLKIRYRFGVKKNPAVKLEELYDMVGHTDGEAWSVVEKAIGNGQSWTELLNEFRMETDKSYESIDYAAIFRKAAEDVLASLKSKGYLLAVASSNGCAVVEHVLEVNHISGFIDAVVGGDRIKKRKPDPQIYLETVAKLGVTAGECVAVEDSTAGITAAHRAGMKVVALIDNRFHFDRSLADYEIDKIEDLLELELL